MEWLRRIVAVGWVAVVAATASPPSAWAGRAGAGVEAFRVARPGKAVAKKARGKPVLSVPAQDVPAYTAAVQADTVEILFKPDELYGHVFVRVGDRILDQTRDGVRDRDFSEVYSHAKSPTYGMVFRVGPARVSRLLAAYRALAATKPRYHEDGNGRRSCSYSCAGYLTSVLTVLEPELGMTLTAGAIPMARKILRTGTYEALSLYGAAAGEASLDEFSFLQLDYKKRAPADVPSPSGGR